MRGKRQRAAVLAGLQVGAHEGQLGIRRVQALRCEVEALLRSQRIALGQPRFAFGEQPLALVQLGAPVVHRATLQTSLRFQAPVGHLGLQRNTGGHQRGRQQPPGGGAGQGTQGSRTMRGFFSTAAAGS